MKRIISLMICIMIAIPLFLTGCGDGDLNKIKVNEVTHSIFYAPLYIAINKGYFEDYGMEIELTNGGGSNNSMTALISGAADIGLMGPETAVYTAYQGKKDLPKVFGQLTKRDGSFIVARENTNNFNWTDLTNKMILGGRRGGMPAMTLEYVLKSKGLIDGTNVTINYDVEFNNMNAAFMGGTGDYVTSFEPSASEIVSANKGYIVASVGQEAGEMPFTAFMANESYIKDNPETIEDFLKAVIKGYRYLTSASIDDVVDAIMPSFDGTSRDIIKKGLQSYLSIDAWVSTPVMDVSAYNRLIAVMKDAGELQQNTNIPFDTIVDNSYAQKAIKALQ